MVDDKKFILAIVLSVAVLVIWQVFVGAPAIEEERARQQEIAESQTAGDSGATPTPDTTPRITDTTIPSVNPSGSPSAGSAPVPGLGRSRGELLGLSPRVAIDTPRLEGSLSLRGARFDDLQLKDYREELDPESPQIVLLSPQGDESAYFADFSWTGAGDSVPMPGDDSLWTAMSSGPLTPENPLRLEWDNGAGLKFTRTIEVDQDYLFTVTQSVQNYGAGALSLYPWGRVMRFGTPSTLGFFILHEGLLGVFNDTLEEINYDDVQEEGEISQKSVGGWIGITDKYWMTALIPDQSREFQGRFTGISRDGQDIYQADQVLSQGQALGPGQTISASSYFFAGAKKVSLVDAYRDNLGIARFDLSIDWGWLFFLTKPFFIALDYFGKLFGNLGVSILIITVITKLLFFPLANKSYVAMSKMKKLQPKMVQIRERYADDKVKQQQELMDLYKREKVNPAAGCLPILVQIPVFFAFYKVLFVTIEMRQAPFFGWIQDLSAPDPTSLFNLFGLIPWDTPDYLTIGIWPVLMGLTMLLQTKLNPAPADPVQEKVFLFMPIFFTYLLAQFPAGLVIYWTWNNILSIIQQYVIMRRMGVEVNFGERFKLPAWLSNATSSLSESKAKETSDTKSSKDAGD